MIGDRDQQALAPDRAGHGPPDQRRPDLEGGRVDVAGHYSGAPWAWTQRLEWRRISSVTASETTSSSIDIAAA